MKSHLEREVKVIGIDVKAVLGRLKELGAKLIFRGRIRDMYLDTPDSRFMKANCVLRLRFMPKQVVLTYKGPRKKGKYKTREEFELVLRSKAEAMNFVKRVGLVQISLQEKERVSYQVGNARIDIDKYPVIPPYLEIEGEDEKGVARTLQQLRLERAKTSTLSSAQFFKKYYPNIDFTHLTF